jgi:hypothetical protein
MVGGLAWIFQHITPVLAINRYATGFHGINGAAREARVPPFIP